MTAFMLRLIQAIVAIAMTFAGHGVRAQEMSAEMREQLLVDLDALIIGTSVSTRCALYESSLDYLTPVESTGADIRLNQIRSTLSQSLGDLPELMAQMREEANAVDCGNQGLEPFLDFSRQIGQDMVDVGLAVWREVSIEECSYFADDDFMAAVGNVRIVAAGTELDGAEQRVAYIQNAAQGWITIFENNCFNVNFDPVPTLPGRIALAVPLQS